MTEVFDALPTFYGGYRFRSRLEARWAVFFDQLDVDYRYELEGYLVAAGRCYLPDFYLPQQDCFVEIKPKLPHTEELEKTRLLALGTGKEVYTFYGDVWLAKQPLSRQICRYTPPSISPYWETSLSGEALHQERVHAYKVAVLLQQLDDVGLSIQIQGELFMLVSNPYFDAASFRAQQYLPVLQRQYEQMIALSAPLQEVHDTLVQALTERADYKPVFMRQHLSWDFAWAECSACGTLSLRNERAEDGPSVLLHEHCPQPQAGRYRDDSARLKRAYEAVRQERFST